MEDKVTAVYDFVMQRCLWQFFSRNWDREANINNIMPNVAKLKNGEKVDRGSNIANSHYADAKVLLGLLTEHVPWFKDVGKKEAVEICDKVREKLLDIAVVNSLNAERTEANY